jgi:predicted ATPase/DNA-binding SARP family transcriptional activator
VKIGVLGPLEVAGDPEPIEISGARLRLLLTVLALEAPRAVSARTLVDALWGDEPPADETNALQSLVSRLRKALGDSDLVKASPAGYQLCVKAADIDVHRFDQLANSGREALRRGDTATAVATLSDALTLWRGELIDIAATEHGHALLARLDEQHLEARADLIEARLALGDSAAVVSELDGLVAAHPLRERLTGLHVQALYAAGRQAEALASYERTRARLADELGVDPSPELRAIHLSVLRNEPAPPTVQSSRRDNLRAALTTFVGRDEQLGQIAKLLDAGRLVTLVGPGGAGKTRLAGEAAAALTSEIVDGVWLIELAPVTDPADVPQTVLGALGLREAILLERSGQPTALDPTTRLVNALTERAAVLVLDNCEHLIDAAAHLADQLLARCPMLRILATSREPLGIVGESLVVVPPLGQPEPDADAAAALTFPAVRLFVDRAADVDAGFTLDDTTVAAVTEIVRRLDGQPLAIELAAARLRSLPVAEIARRLSDRFRLLTGGSRTAMPRHRTLRAVVEWSWDLLTDSERLLAERLAVFSGGVTASAAAAVCGGTELDPDDIEDLLASLIDKSLLHAIPGPALPRRYRMLETIREFGLERMGDRAEVGAIRSAHARHFAALVAAADPHLRSHEQLEWLEILRLDRDNILAALKYFSDDGQAGAAVELAVLLGWYWMVVGSHGETVTWVSVALAVPGESDPGQRLLADAFLAINAIAWDVKGSHDEVAAGLAHLDEVGRRMAEPPENAPKMLTLLAPIVAMFTGDQERAGLLTERALHDDDPWIAAAVRTFRAMSAENAGDLVTMRSDAESALAVFRSLGERWGMANSLQILGQLELMEGNLDAAAAAYREGLELATQIGGREDVAMMRLRLADIYARLGQFDAAREESALAVVASEDSSTTLEVLFTLIVQVELARTSGDLDSARRSRDDALARIGRLPASHPMHGRGLAILLATVAKIDIEDGGIDSARRNLDEAFPVALSTRDMPILAGVGVSVAMLAAALDRPADAAEILGAAAQLRGADDATQIDIRVLDQSLGGLSAGPYAADYTRGRNLDRDAAIIRANPATLDP